MWTFGFEWLSSTLFPSQCLGCQLLGAGYLCPECRAELKGRTEMVGGVPLLTMGCYDGVLRSVLMAVKSRGHRAAGRELARHGVERWLAQRDRLPAQARIHAVRASRAGQKLRGFSLPRMLADELHHQSGWPLLEASLADWFPLDSNRSRGLGVEERWTRRQARAVPEELRRVCRGALVLVDDVVTTGATMTATVSVARELGFSPIVCLALATAPVSLGES